MTFSSMPRHGVAKGLLAAGVAAIAAVFLLPTFLLKVGVLVVGASCAGQAVLPALAGRDGARRIAFGFVVAGLTAAVASVASEFVVRAVLADITTMGNSTDFFARRWREGLPPPNSHGFRENEFAPRPAEGVYRIAVIGDSFTYGLGIDREERMTERLQEILEASRPHVEVLNFGLPGRETADHIETLRDVVLPAEPDFVLMQWLSNDVEGRDKSGRPRALPLVPSDAATAWLHQHSALYALASVQWRRVQRAVGILESYQSYMDGRFSDPASADMVAAESDLRTFVRLARDAGAGIGIVAFPNLVAAEAIEDYPFGYLIERVIAVCEKEGVPCLDLRGAFLGRAGQEGWWANRLDSHPGPAANAVAADAVSSFFGEHWESGVALDGP